MRIAVVGAGPSGLVTLFVIKQRLIGKIPDLEVVAFERHQQLGGEWFFSEEPETYDDLGNPMNSNIYKGLQTNNSIAFMQLHSHFPWPEDIGESFPRCHRVLEYLQSFASTFSLCKYIKFSNLVKMVRHHSSRLGFIVDVKDINTELTTSEAFDYVFMCSGQFLRPYIPEYDLSNFKGEAFHYHFLRNPTPFFGKRILVVGAGFGAMDLTILFAKTSPSFYVSYSKREPFWNNSREAMVVKPRMVKVFGNTVSFIDGSSVDVDVIIFATGFRQDHPLSPELSLDFNQSSCLFPLYQHVVHPKYPRLFFVGKALFNIILSMQYHAEFGCAVIDGSVVLPSCQDMENKINEFKKRWVKELQKYTTENGDQATYFPPIELEIEVMNLIAKVTKCSPLQPYIRPLTYSLFTNVKYDVFEYRNYSLEKELENVPSSGQYFHKKYT